mmetsp:Transcript_22631/g.63574  ORF Transcript_22631/g.63574 Transcript_22631/m.63574 type:complete len:256 (+) Transcript_22631:91-858(+)
MPCCSGWRPAACAPTSPSRTSCRPRWRRTSASGWPAGCSCWRRASRAACWSTGSWTRSCRSSRGSSGPTPTRPWPWRTLWGGCWSGRRRRTARSCCRRSSASAGCWRRPWGRLSSSRGRPPRSQCPRCPRTSRLRPWTRTRAAETPRPPPPPPGCCPRWWPPTPPWWCRLQCSPRRRTSCRCGSYRCPSRSPFCSSRSCRGASFCGTGIAGGGWTERSGASPPLRRAPGAEGKARKPGGSTVMGRRFPLGRSTLR